MRIEFNSEKAFQSISLSIALLFAIKYNSPLKNSRKLYWQNKQ